MSKLREERARLSLMERAPSTRAGYESDWGDFRRWCEAAGRAALPAAAETLELYLVDRGHRLKVTTLERRAAAVAYMHVQARYASPVGPGVRAVLSAMARQRGSAPEPKAVLTPEQLREISGALGRDARGARDRAVMVLGFASGLRRSELAALELGDVELVAEGLIVNVRRSKTDQQGAGRAIGVHPGQRADTCPVRTLRAWLDERGEWAGPLFARITWPSGRVLRRGIRGVAVGAIVKRAVALTGLDPADYGAHSLRAGMCTAAAECGTPDSLIMQRSGHRSARTLRRYVRPAELFRRDPLASAL